jgi:BA14K-like protein
MTLLIREPNFRCAFDPTPAHKYGSPQGDTPDGGSNMANYVSRLVATTVFAAGLSSVATVTSATPVADALAIKNAVPASVDTVQWRRGWGGGGWGGRRGWGWGGVGAGFVAGAIIGGALASPYYYGYGPYYPRPYYVAPPPPVYYVPPPPVYGAPVAGDAVAYCMQRFRSYDPASGTYLGYDGFRHPCP